MKKYIAELIGTFTLVFLGYSTFVFTASTIGVLVVIISALTFGFVLAGIYNTISKVSAGAHINPACYLRSLCSRQNESYRYSLLYNNSILGGLLGALGVYFIAMGNENYQLIYSLGENGFDPLSLGSYGIISAIIF